MLVRELMTRTGMTAFGMARMLIEDGLTEMAVMQESFVKETSLTLFKNQRFYDTPREAIRITDIMVRNHLNSKQEYQSIPRLLNKPKIKDTTMGYDQTNEDAPQGSDLNGTFTDVSRVADLNHEVDTKAREYAYFWEGNRLGIVEKEIYSTTTGDITDDTNAYQKGSYNWVSPQINGPAFIKVRYTYIPVYNDRENETESDTSRVWIYHNLAAADATHQLQFVCADIAEWPNLTAQDVSSSISAGDYFSVTNLGYMSGLWECVSVSTANVRAKRPLYIHGGWEEVGDIPVGEVGAYVNVNTAPQPIPVLCLNTRSLYQHQEDYFLPITMYQAQALMCYIKYRMLEEVGEFDKALYYEKKFKSKIEKQKTANIPGPRMISAGPFALK